MKLYLRSTVHKLQLLCIDVAEFVYVVQTGRGIGESMYAKAYDRHEVCSSTKDHFQASAFVCGFGWTRIDEVLV